MKLNHPIYLHSIQNARELGGYITVDGRRITKGLLLRTVSLNGISNDDSSEQRRGHSYKRKMNYPLADRRGIMLAEIYYNPSYMFIDYSDKDTRRVHGINHSV